MTNELYLQQDVFDAIEDELESAVTRHGFERTPLNSEMPHTEKLTILVEEVGEVARALTYDEYDTDKLYKELIQTATMAAAWANSLLSYYPKESE